MGERPQRSLKILRQSSLSKFTHPNTLWDIWVDLGFKLSCREFPICQSGIPQSVKHLYQCHPISRVRGEGSINHPIEFQVLKLYYSDVRIVEEKSCIKCSWLFGPTYNRFAHHSTRVEKVRTFALQFGGRAKKFVRNGLGDVSFEMEIFHGALILAAAGFHGLFSQQHPHYCKSAGGQTGLA